ERIERREGLSVREESLTLKAQRVMTGEEDVLVVGIFVERRLVGGSVLEIVRPDERHVVGLLDVEWLIGEPSACTSQKTCACCDTNHQPDDRQLPCHGTLPQRPRVVRNL